MILNETGSSKADTAVKLALIFFISLFSFSVGTFVGKQVSDTERRRASLEEDFGKDRGIASEHESDEEKALSENDVDQLTEDFLQAEQLNSKKEDSNQHGDSTSKDSHAEEETNNHKKESEHIKDHSKSEDSAHKKENSRVEKIDPKKNKDGYAKINRDLNKKTENKNESHKKSNLHKVEKNKSPHENTKVQNQKPHKEKVSQSARRIADNRAPSSLNKKTIKPSKILPKLPPTAIGKYTVQVSSYPSEKEAKNHAKELKQTGYSAFYIPALVKGKIWYRVSIGLFDSYKSANYFRKELKKQAKLNSTIIQKIVK